MFSPKAYGYREQKDYHETEDIEFIKAKTVTRLCWYRARIP